MLNWFAVTGKPRTRGTPSRPYRRRFTRVALKVESLEGRTLPTQLLIGTYNVDISDKNGSNRISSEWQPVLAAIGQEDTYNAPQNPDILTVTEVRSNSNTGSNNDTEWLTEQMNAVYGAGIYSHGTLNGGSLGGGTEGVIYNTQTVSLLQEKAVGTLSSNGTERQELRYLFRPVGYNDGSADFYVYVGHPKAGSTTQDQNQRYVEATQVRADADALGPGVPILYTGDFNSDSSNQAAEQEYLSPGNGQAFDPINRLGNWGYNSAFVDVDSIASTKLNSRFDMLWETGVVVNGSGSTSIQDMPATYHSLGNNGSVPLYGSVASSSNTALPDLPNRTTVLSDLTKVSDHIPTFMDYQIGGQAQAVSLAVIAPSSVTSGTPFDVTVAALDVNGNIVPTYTGTVTFATTDQDQGVMLPPNYQFKLSDQGQVTFPAEVTLITPGDQLLVAYDINNNSIGGGTDVYVNSSTVACHGSRPSSAAPVGAVGPFGVVASTPAGQTSAATGTPTPVTTTTSQGTTGTALFSPVAGNQQGAASAFGFLLQHHGDLASEWLLTDLGLAETLALS